ncbi:MAG: hypothetical protein KAS57_04090 [Gammaproteobacteria bacterium]|nr:hypothetical protein [Gammaproteobacteria bacterium]
MFACFFCNSTQAITEQHVIIVSSGNNSHHKSLVENILSNLKISNIKAETFYLEQTININTNSSLIISLGHEAAALIDQKKLPNPKLRVFTDTNPNIDPEHKSESHLSMTQPVCQQFALAQLLNPDWKLISVLLSTTNTPLIKNLASCAKRYKLKLNTIILKEYINIIDALNTSLPSSGVLLALPDPAIYNAKTIKSILLTTYRHRVPIIGFSENFVRAGALAAMHSSTEQLGRQISELIQKHYNNENINTHLYPEYFDVTTNKNVARSLGIQIPDRKILTKKLQEKYHE